MPARTALDRQSRCCNRGPVGRHGASTTRGSRVQHPEPLLRVDALVVEFEGRRGRKATRAVDDVTLALGIRETVGLVGESGAGKSTIGRAVLGLVPVTSGVISFGGKEITN